MIFLKSRTRSSWTSGDFDDDGFNELVSVSAGKGELVFFNQMKMASLELSKHFLFSWNFRHLLHNHDDKAHLLIVSPEEEVLKIIFYDENKDFHFLN